MVARAVHNALRSYAQWTGESGTSEWHTVSRWVQHQTLERVQYALRNPGTTPEKLHEVWCAARTAEGWRRGPGRDIASKTHNALVPFADLNPIQKHKDRVLLAIVEGFRPVEVAP